MWLTPGSVDDYDPADFSFLGDEQQAKLTRSVERFRAVAEKVPGSKPATREQEQEARAAFDDILQLLQPLQFRDAESFRTQTLMRRELRGKLPKWVTSITCETGVDLIDEPAIRIWLDVTDDAVDKRKIEKHGNAIHDTVDEAYRRIGGKRWPFVRFRSPDAFAMSKGVSA